MTVEEYQNLVHELNNPDTTAERKTAITMDLINDYNEVHKAKTEIETDLSKTKESLLDYQNANAKLLRDYGSNLLGGNSSQQQQKTNEKPLTLEDIERGAGLL